MGYPNIDPYLLLLNAEDMAVNSNSGGKLTNTYNDAIRAMASGGIVHLEALANERAGFAAHRYGDHRSTETYLDRAMHICKYDWGATAKFDWLTEVKDSLLSDCRTEDTSAFKLIGNIVQVKCK